MTKTELEKSTGFKRLDDATLKWIKEAKFAPGEVNGVPVAVCRYPLMYEWKRDSTDRASLTKLYPQLQDLKPEQLPQLPVDLAPPVYPTESLAKREKGKVELTVCLGKEGKVETIAMWKSSGSQRLDTATGRWIAKAQFSPAMKDGVAVGVCGVPVEYTWKPPG